MPTSKKPSKKMPLRDRFRRFLGGSPDEPDEPDSPASRTPRQPEHGSRNAEPNAQPLNTPRVLELKGLWKEAYEDLRKDDSELVDAYESAVSRECDSQAAEEAGADPEGGMRGFVKHRLQEIQDSHHTVTVAGKSIGIKDQARRAVHAILSVKDFISSAVSTEPHAALAWAGVLVLLHPILKSFTQEEDSIDGFERISGLLVRYRVIECTHIEVPSSRTGSSSDKPVEDLEASIRSETVKLYSMILRYQMRLLKHFSRSGFFRFMEDLRVTDDWREMLQMIVAVEESINENLGALRGHILRQIEAGVAQLKDQLKLAQDTMVEARDEAKTAKQDNLLNSLPFAGGAAFNSWEDQHKARCLEGTQNSTLAQIQSWKESPDRETIYWLKGMAGTGKSTISRTLATACYDQTPLFQGASQKSVSNAVLGAGFFFDRTKPDRNNASKLVTTICRQIAITIPEIKADICSSISKYPSVGTQSLNNQWEYLVLAPLRLFEKRMLVPLTLITVIDALDECEGEADLAAFLQLIAQAPPLTSIALKFFITSRPEAHVRSDFRVMAGVSIFEAELHKVALLPETLTADYKDDITRYLEHEITKLTPTKSIDDWPGKNRINELARKSDGLFIYAATACLFLSGAKGHEDRLDMRLNMIFDDRVADGSPQKSLDGIYTRILRYSVIGGAIDEEKELICRRFRLIVGSIVILFEPLTTAALGYLLGQPVSQVKDTLGELYSVLAMGDEQLPIQLLHLSFRDFLLNPARCIDQGFLVSEKETHTALFRHCLGVLKVVLRKNICNLPSFGVCAADITPITLHQHLPEGAQYACRYWPAHLQRAGLEPADEDEVYSFLKTHLLHWLEALSLMHKFSDGIVAVLKLSDYISALPGPPRIALVGILHDAKRFMRRFNLVIEAAPLQVYSSALIHSPERSVIRQHFQGEIPKWIKRAPEVKAEWDPLLQTLHDTLRPEDIALSPDGTRVASSNLRIWDTETGALLWDFDPLGAGYRVAFSPDGQFVMSISVPGHVRVWNLASGLLIQEVASSLEKSPLPPLHLFSADRTIAVIASYTLKFEVIDIRNGTSLRIIEGPEDALLHMALSNDGVLLASGSTDGCVRLWDVRTGILQHEFAGYLDAIGRVVFSPDDKLLASVSNDKTVKVWDLREGEQLAELSGEFLDLAFLDSAILMCSQPDHSNIQVWDVISNKQETLHGPCCKGLRLSPDGTLLTSVQFRRVEASTLQGPTVAIWSLETGKLVHRLEGHSDCISNAIFSADNKLLASASHDGTIRLWDLSAQASPERLDGHTESVCSIIVSPDLRVAASRAGHDRIRLWDVETGFLRQKFDGNFMADPFFSPDGKLFYVPLGKEVQVWSIATCELTRCINCYSTQVSCSAFSPDGSLLALKYANTNLCLPKDRTLGGTVDAGNDPGVDTDELRLFGCGEPHFISSTIMPPEVGIWNSATGSLLQVAKGASEDHGCLAFSPNGRFLAFGPHHTSVKRILSGGWIAIWDVPNGELSVLGDFVKDVAAISWCSDGNALASIILDDTWERQIQIWDMTTRSLNTSIKTKTWPHLTAFSPDGQLLLSASHDGTYQLWEARTGTMIGQRESLWGAQRLKFSEDANMIDTGLNRLELASFYPGWVPTDSTEFFLTGNWVRQGQLALLLPNDDPPTCAATADGVLIMGHESGRVTFLLLGEE